jgi:hypothetical protein
MEFHPSSSLRVALVSPKTLSIVAFDNAAFLQNSDFDFGAFDVETGFSTIVTFEEISVPAHADVNIRTDAMVTMTRNFIQLCLRK